MRVFKAISIVGELTATRWICPFDCAIDEALLERVRVDYERAKERGQLPSFHWIRPGGSIDHYPNAIVFDEEPDFNQYGEVHP